MYEGEPITDYEALRQIGIKAAHQVFPHRTRGLVGVIRDENQCFTDIARSLRQFTPEQQGRFLNRALGPEGANFHNSEAVASYLVRMANIRLPAPLSLDEIQKRVSLHRLALENNPLEAALIDKDHLPQIRLQAENYYSLTTDPRREFIDSIFPSDRIIESNRVNMMVNSALSSTAYHDLNWYAPCLRESVKLIKELIVVQDLVEDSSSIGDSIEPILELLEMGAYAIGPAKVRTGRWWFQKQEKFAAYVPVVENSHAA